MPVTYRVLHAIGRALLWLGVLLNADLLVMIGTQWTGADRAAIEVTLTPVLVEIDERGKPHLARPSAKAIDEAKR